MPIPYFVYKTHEIIILIIPISLLIHHLIPSEFMYCTSFIITLPNPNCAMNSYGIYSTTHEKLGFYTSFMGLPIQILQNWELSHKITQKKKLCYRTMLQKSISHKKNDTSHRTRNTSLYSLCYPTLQNPISALEFNACGISDRLHRDIINFSTINVLELFSFYDST